jgi:hypothetical protein
MNIFGLSESPVTAAQMMVDCHVVKMILETAQLLSTAHRVLDGELYIDKTSNGRNIKRWRLSDSDMESALYKATHVNHPCAIWCRQSHNNYQWLFEHFEALCDEYTYRYGKVHKTDTLLRVPLKLWPVNIPRAPATELPQAMPGEFKSEAYKTAYRRYYAYKNTQIKNFAAWTKRGRPFWWSIYVPGSSAAA